MGCKYCGLPIYPPGVTYTGQACWFNGNHPEAFSSPLVRVVEVHDHSVKMLVQDIRTHVDAQEWAKVDRLLKALELVLAAANPSKEAHPKGEHKLKASKTKTCEFCGALYVGSFKPKHLCNQRPTPSSVESEDKT